ncbi:hypothetical protein COL5a_009200 [Colletotrichum fioriniae]|nr:hypothetical protein COL5a_009200 [Colletotrichum fioriniae]
MTQLVWLITGCSSGLGLELSREVLKRDSAARIHGRIDVLVNNAGHGIAGGFEDLRPPSLSDFQTLFDTNLFGTIRATQAVLPHMRAAHSGTIINISSTGGLRGLAAVSAYSSSKFAVEGLSESLAAEYADFGIRVILVEPGPFRTLFRDQPGFPASRLPRGG